MSRKTGTTGKAATLSPDQVRRLIKIAGTTRHGERDQMTVVISYWLGLRAKEIASLKVGDVYDESGTVKEVLHLKRSYTKKNKSRDVFLSSVFLRKKLTEYHRYLQRQKLLDPETPLFVTKSRKSFTANGMVKLLSHLHKQAGVEKASSHSGRRTMITRLAESGVDLKAISTLAGHSSISTTAGYVEDNPDRLAKIMEKVEVV